MGSSNYWEFKKSIVSQQRLLFCVEESKDVCALCPLSLTPFFMSNSSPYAISICFWAQMASAAGAICITLLPGTLHLWVLDAPSQQHSRWSFFKESSLSSQYCACTLSDLLLAWYPHHSSAEAILAESLCNSKCVLTLGLVMLYLFAVLDTVRTLSYDITTFGSFSSSPCHHSLLF
jgi:hypothetical protein